MRVRESARGIVFNTQGQVLLLECEDAVPVDPRNPDVLRYWVTPGGGLEENESFETALARELWEETGLTDVEIATCVWTRELEFNLPDLGLVRCHERCFLCRTERDVNLDVAQTQMTDSERNIIKETRWWSLDELVASSEIFRPEGFVELVRRLVRDGAPVPPVCLHAEVPTPRRNDVRRRTTPRLRRVSAPRPLL